MTKKMEVLKVAPVVAKRPTKKVAKIRRITLPPKLSAEKLPSSCKPVKVGGRQDIVYRGDTIPEPTIEVTPWLTAGGRRVRYLGTVGTHLARWVFRVLLPHVESTRYEEPVLRLLDYGCGNGRDVAFYKKNGKGKLKVFGYDPFLKPDDPAKNGPYDIITAHFVLNTIPTYALRVEAMRQMASLLKPDGVLVIATRSLLMFLSEIHEMHDRFHKFASPSYIAGRQIWGDGIIHHIGSVTSKVKKKKGIFQHGFTHNELSALAFFAGLKVYKPQGMPWLKSDKGSFRMGKKDQHYYRHGLFMTFTHFKNPNKKALATVF